MLTGSSRYTALEGRIGSSDSSNGCLSRGVPPHGPSQVRRRKSINVIALDELGTNGVVWTLQTPAHPLRALTDGKHPQRRPHRGVTFAIQGVDRSLSFMRFL